jgi:hypothetical protein
MNNLFDESDVAGILSRIDKLTPEAKREWGKMNVSQMLAHCNAALSTASGADFPKRLFIGRILGSFVKPSYLNDKQLSKNSPTDKIYIFSDARDFEIEKNKTISLIKKFHEGGVSKCTTHPHSFFGKFTPEEWAISQWKHFDHHLRQFGV